MWCAAFPGVVLEGGVGLRSRLGVASFVCWWPVVSHVPGWGRGLQSGMVVLGCVVAFPVGGGGTVSRSGGVGGCLWMVLGRCGAAPCGLLVVPLVCFSTWAVRGRCGVGPGVPWGGVCGIGVSQPGGCGRVVLGGVGQPLSGPSGAGSAVYGPRADCHVSLRAHLDQVPLNYPSETVVQPSSTAHFHYGFPTVEPLSWYSNKLLSSNLKTAIFQPSKRCHTP